MGRTLSLLPNSISGVAVEYTIVSVDDGDGGIEVVDVSSGLGTSEIPATATVNDEKRDFCRRPMDRRRARGVCLPRSGGRLRRGGETRRSILLNRWDSEREPGSGELEIEPLYAVVLFWNQYMKTL